MSAHVSVLLEESIQALDVQSAGWYLDATFGRGGHSHAILARLGTEGRLFALDRDPEAAVVARQLQAEDGRFQFCHAPFGELASAFAEVAEQSLDGVLFDLGVSSPQLDTPERGFSFNKEGPLDMRMNPEVGLSAREWLMSVSEQELAQVIRDFGGESFSIAKRLAKAIYSVRERLQTTVDLANVVADAMPKKFFRPGYHPATQTFQAVRMAVNDEFGEIQRGLTAAVKCLKSGGVLTVISFHGGEDAMVKRFIRRCEGEALPAEIPTDSGRVNQILKLVNPVIKPSATAVAENPRARSARLRKAIKL